MRNSRYIFNFHILVIAIIISLTPVTTSFGQLYRVETAPEWNTLFDRNSGWSGADGIYSIPLNGDERTGGDNPRGTFFVFSDTFIGDVDDEGHRLPGTVMVNNTVAWMPPGEPDPESLLFFHGLAPEDTSSPRAVFVPNTPNTQPGEWYWLMDGIALEDSVYIFALRMYSTPDIWFDIAGISLVSMSIDTRPPFPEYFQRELPVFLEATEDHGKIHFGVGILPNTETAGAPFPDGYIYIYGLDEVPFNKYALVARVPEEHFNDIDQWRYYDGQVWVEDIESAARLTDRVSSEMSVSPLGDGRFIMTFQLDTISRFIAFRIGETPWGPWNELHEIYACPEPRYLEDEDVWCYNAKAHPHLSQQGELLISYNVNVLDFWTHFDYADIYRPRFIRLIYTGQRFFESGVTTQVSSLPSEFEIKSIYPNPFNPETTVTISLPQLSALKVSVFNTVGQEVAVLADGEFKAGIHDLSFEATGMASGLYFIRAIVPDKLNEIRKVVLVK